MYLHASQVAHQAGAYPGFCSIKWLGVFLLPPGWDASPSQGYPPALNSPVAIYTPGWREALWEWSVLSKNTTQCPRPVLEPGPLDPETSALTMRPPRLSYSQCIPEKARYFWMIQTFSAPVVDFFCFSRRDLRWRDRNCYIQQRDTDS